MLPQVNLQQRSRNRYRPITSADNASTTGLAVNPVGAMIPVSDPTNGAFGGSGQYGAMLPQTNVGPSRLPQQGGGGMSTYNANAFVNNIVPNVFNALQSYGPQMQTTPYMTSNANFTTANSFYTPTNAAQMNQQINQQNSVQQLINQGVPPSVAAQMANKPGFANLTTANSFLSGAGGVNLQPGLNNSQFVTNIGAQILSDPDKFDALPPSAQDAIRQSLSGGAGGPGGVNADPANSPGGRFIQVGEKRWERNKNGRLVQVQYTGGGSWRNKRVVTGGKGMHKQRLAGQQQPVQPGSSNIPSYGVVQMSLNTGTG